MKANIGEVFISIQGEGLWVGKRQVFIRFAGCNLRCKFCDTKPFQEKTKECIIFDEKIENPISALWLEEKIKDIQFHSITLTGGEPLLQADFIKEFLSSKKYIVYLDTNGSLPNEFVKIKDLVSLVCMDMKLPSSTGGMPLWDKHKMFLALGNNIFVKIVVTEETEEDDLHKAIEIISNVSPKIPLVLQPSRFDIFNKVFHFQTIALKSLLDVRIIPQIHKILATR